MPHDDGAQAIPANAQSWYKTAIHRPIFSKVIH